MFAKTYSSSLVISLFFLTEIRTEVECIQCYQCNSLIDDVRECSVSPPSSTFLKDCSNVHEATNELFKEEDIWCRKIRNHRMPNKPGHRRSIVRECAYKHWDKETCFRGKYQLICECNGDACNGCMPNIQYRYLSLFIAVTLSIIYFFI